MGQCGVPARECLTLIRSPAAVDSSVCFWRQTRVTAAAVADHPTPYVPGGSAADPLPLAGDRPVPRALLLGIFVGIAGLYALLWSPYWYPLSDSSLYLVMARALAQGRGIGFMRVIHRDVRPFTPMM